MSGQCDLTRRTHMSVTRPVKERRNPRMSAPKLGEYVDCGATRRERIIRDQKFPADFITARYRDAEDAIRASMLSGSALSRLSENAQMLDMKEATNAHQAEVRASCAQAVRRFARMYADLPLAGVTPMLIDNRKMQIEGVEVSVRPTLRLQRRNRSGVEECGAMLLVMSKSIKLTDRSGGAVAALLRQALVEAGFANVHPSLCMVVDVFARKVYTPPRATKRLSHEIACACREIAARWPALAA